MPLIDQRKVRIGPNLIYYQVAGAGEPVLLLHGLSGSVQWWKKNINVLARHFRVYAVDLIGFGASRGQRFVLEEAAGLIQNWMESLGEDSYHLIGHSMGGLVAAELASNQPKRVGGLVLVDAVAVPLGHSIIGSALRLPPALRYAAPDFLPVLIYDALRAGPVNLLRASMAIHRADITADLGRISNRTLVIWGEHDTLLPVSRGEALHRALPGSEFIVIRGAGHNPMWDRADEFNRVVTRFLEAKEDERGS